jgi:hypothetical protein
MNRRTTPQRRIFKRLTKKSALFAVLVALVIGGILYFSVFKNDSNQAVNKPSGSTSTDSGNKEIDLKPPTQTEKQQVESNKEQIVKRDEQINNASTPASSSGLKQVSITITEASAERIAAFTSDIFESGGQCTATAVKGSQIITKTSEGLKASNYTQCTVFWDNPLEKGIWTMSISYKSVTAEGTASKTKEVQ